MIARILLIITLVPASAFSQVPAERIAAAEKEPSNWLTYSGNYQSHRYSSMTQITRENVGRLKTAWIYQVRRTGIVETSPIVITGVPRGREEASLHVIRGRY